MPRQPVKSAGGVVYYIDKTTGQPRFLLLKRQALSNKVEWILPKGKIKSWETPEEAAKREVSEEIGVRYSDLTNEGFLDKVEIKLQNESWGRYEKDVDYYLMHYSGDPENLNIISWEGYVGTFKWADLKQALQLINYQNLRLLVKKAYEKLTQKNLSSNDASND